MFCFKGFLTSFLRLVFIFLIWKCLSDSWVDDFFSCCLYDRDLILTIFDVTSFLTSFLSSFTNTFQKNLVPCMCCLGFFIILFWCVHVSSLKDTEPVCGHCFSVHQQQLLCKQTFVFHVKLHWKQSLVSLSSGVSCSKW